MRSLRTFLAVVFVLGLFCAVGVGAGAASPTQASGGITVITNTGSVAEVVFTGTLSGSATELYTAVVRSSGKVDVQGNGSFTGSVDGQAGTLTYHFNGHGRDGALAGQITIIRGTGALAGVKGHISYDGVGNDFEYHGVVVL
jgi:Protein of unknown function (DUF3224)